MAAAAAGLIHPRCILGGFQFARRAVRVILWTRVIAADSRARIGIRRSPEESLARATLRLLLFCR